MNDAVVHGLARDAGLDVTIVRAVALTDGEQDGMHSGVVFDPFKTDVPEILFDAPADACPQVVTQCSFRALSMLGRRRQEISLRQAAERKWSWRPDRMRGPWRPVRHPLPVCTPRNLAQQAR